MKVEVMSCYTVVQDNIKAGGSLEPTKYEDKFYSSVIGVKSNIVYHMTVLSRVFIVYYAIVLLFV